MSELNVAQREALYASADKHEDAAKSVRAAIDLLNSHGYGVYARELNQVVARMIDHVDTARDLARSK